MRLGAKRMFHGRVRTAAFCAHLAVAATLGVSQSSTAQGVRQLYELAVADALPDERFGGQVDVHDDLLVVGAAGDDDACGDTQDCESGAAYVYSSVTGDLVFKLVASRARRLDLFGIAVAIDRQHALVGALSDEAAGANAGAAYIFDLETGTELHKLVPDDATTVDLFGRAVDIEGGACCRGSHPG